MKKTNKKGFTIVELVIVIAVIAVLAAVLIPTFAGVIRKANIASDTAVARNLNEVIALSETEVNTFEDALVAMKDGGYLIANLNAKTNGCYFVWEADSKQILLVDSKDDFKVLYANKEAYTAIGSSWNIAISDVAKADEIVGLGKGVTVKRTMASASDLKAALVAGATQTLYVDESVVIDKDNTLGVTSGNITLNLGSSAINTNGFDLENTAPVSVAAGATLTVNGGVIGGAGTMTNRDGVVVVRPINAEGGTLNLKDTVINITAAKESSGEVRYGKNSNGTIDNVTIESTGLGFSVMAGSNVTINSANVDSYDRALWVSSSGVAAGQETVLTVNGGTYKSAGVRKNSEEVGAVTVFANAGDAIKAKIVINGGTFDCENGNVLCFYQNYGTIEIKGGTFGDVSYENLTASAIEAMTYAKGGGTVVVTGDTANGFVVTIG